MNKFTGIALIVLSSLAYGAMPIFVRLAYADGASTTTVLFIRFVTASVILLTYIIASQIPFPPRRTVLELILLGLLGYVGQSLAFFTAIRLAPASLVSLLLYVSPVFVTIGAFVFFKERITGLKLAALTVALTGAILTATSGSQMGGQNPTGGPTGVITGIVLGILAAAIGAGYVLAGSRVLRSVPTIPATTIVISSTAAAYTVIALSQGLTLPQHWTGYAAILAMSIISTVFAISTFMAGLQRVGPANASTLGVLEPAFTVFLAAIILGETLFTGQIIGGLMIAAGVVMISRTV